MIFNSLSNLSFEPFNFIIPQNNKMNLLTNKKLRVKI
jgi:hypothetical protein